MFFGVFWCVFAPSVGLTEKHRDLVRFLDSRWQFEGWGMGNWRRGEAPT